MDVLSELKGLSDASDIVINSGRNHDQRLVEWFQLVQEITTVICKGETSIADDGTFNSESAINTKIPCIVSFTTDVEKINRKKQRISSTLAQMQRHHISHSKKNSKKFESQDIKNETKNTPLNQHEETTYNNMFTSSISCKNVVETPSNNNKKESLLHGNRMEDYFTPPQNNHNISQCHEKEVEISEKGSKKRKSPPRPLSPIVIIKKVKFIQSKVSIQKKSLRKSLKGQNGKTSESRLPKSISRLPSTKISVNAVNSSVLKENQKLKMKLASDNSRLLKKAQADINMKIQETKKQKEEKMQVKKVEKTLLKTVLDPNKKRLQEATSNGNSKVKNGLPSAEKMTANNSGTPIKTPQKTDIKKNVQESENYEMTPLRTSFVSYDISEIKSSDDENETESDQTERKPIPEWASGVRLRNALVQQQYHSINTDELFGNVFETPNLCQMMGEQKKKYLKKRTSSAVWNSPSAFK